MADDFIAGRLRSVRVLVVEDHDDSRDVLTMSLEYAGALVSTASSAREAPPLTPVVDVVVTDMSMPGEDGAWLLAQVEESRRPHRATRRIVRETRLIALRPPCAN